MAKTINKNDDGFASIQFIFLMGFTIILLTGFLNILLIEYSRNSARSSLREAARTGTRAVDLKQAFNERLTDSTKYDLAISECKNSGEESLKDLIKEDGLTIACEITINTANGVASMKATLLGVPQIAIVPWAIPYEDLRLTDLSVSFVQREAAE